MLPLQWNNVPFCVVDICHLSYWRNSWHFHLRLFICTLVSLASTCSFCPLMRAIVMASFWPFVCYGRNGKTVTRERQRLGPIEHSIVLEGIYCHHCQDSISFTDSPKCWAMQIEWSMKVATYMQQLRLFLLCPLITIAHCRVLCLHLLLVPRHSWRHWATQSEHHPFYNWINYMFIAHQRIRRSGSRVRGPCQMLKQRHRAIFR